MATMILLNETTAAPAGTSQPTLYRAGASISDPALQAALQAEGGVLLPATDPVLLAMQATIATRLRSRGADERYSSAAMMAAALTSAAASLQAAPQIGYRVRNVATANVASLSAYTVAGNDGVTNVAGDGVLLVGQTTTSQNGPWIVGTVTAGVAPLTRPAWWGTTTVQAAGAVFYVSEGTAYANSEWKATSAGSVTVDTTSMPLYPRVLHGTITLSGGAATLSNQYLLAGAVCTATDTTAAAATKAVVTAGAGTGSIAFTGTTTDVLAYIAVNW